MESCADIIFDQWERSSSTELVQGTVFRTLYKLQRYSENLHRPIGSKFLFWGISKAAVQSSLWAVNVCNMLVKAMNCTAVSIQVQELKTELEGLQTAIVEQEAAIVSLHTELFKKTDQLAFITDEKVDWNLHKKNYWIETGNVQRDTMCSWWWVPVINGCVIRPWEEGLQWIRIVLWMEGVAKCARLCITLQVVGEEALEASQLECSQLASLIRVCTLYPRTCSS